MTDSTDIGRESMRHDRYMALLGTFHRHIEHYCVAHSNSRADADDLMQEVFIAVWENIDGLRAESSSPQMNRWLHKVMRTVFVRHIHRERRYIPLEEQEEQPQTPNYDEELLDDLVAHLPDDDQHLLQLRFAGYSNIEIAQRLGLKGNTLNQRMSRIAKKMKDIYTQLYESR